MKLLFPFAKSLLLYLLLCIATYMMLRILIDYTAFRNDVGFLRFKAPYVNYPWWKAAFYVHVFTAILALLAGFTQFSSLVLQDHRRLHRLVGRIYAYDILIVNFPELCAHLFRHNASDVEIHFGQEHAARSDAPLYARCLAGVCAQFAGCGMVDPLP